VPGVPICRAPGSARDVAATPVPPAAAGHVGPDRGDDQVSENPEESTPWQQRMLDNIWVLLALSIVVPGVLYLGWGLWELAELPTWGQ
jgi:hypothetical protein